MKTILSMLTAIGLIWLAAWIGHINDFDLHHWWAMPYLATCVIVIMSATWIVMTVIDKMNREGP